MTALRRRLATIALLSAVAALSALGLPEVASAHPSKSAIAAATAGAGATHRVPRLKRLRQHGGRRS